MSLSSTLTLSLCSEHFLVIDPSFLGLGLVSLPPNGALAFKPPEDKAV